MITHLDAMPMHDRTFFDRWRKFTYFEEWYWPRNHTLVLYLTVSFAYATVLLQTLNDKAY
jgi:hypothetical protein